MDTQDEMLANFAAITGSDSVSARSILEVETTVCIPSHRHDCLKQSLTQSVLRNSNARLPGCVQATGYDLEQAVGLYFAQQADEGSAAHAHHAVTGLSQQAASQAGYASPNRCDLHHGYVACTTRMTGRLWRVPSRTHQCPSSYIRPSPYTLALHALQHHNHPAREPS